MSTAGDVARTELRLIRRDATWVALIVLVVVAAAAAVNGAQRWERQTFALTDMEQSEAMLFDAVQARAVDAPVDPPPATSQPGALGFSILSRNAILPAAPLAPLALGQSDLHAAHFPVTAHAPYTFMNRSDIANPLSLATGSFDLAFVVVFVLPIFVIALVYDLMSRERERGTLALVVAHGVAMRHFALAKCAARAALILGVVNVVNAVAIALAGVDFAEPGTLISVAMWMLATSLYACFWFALALVVNVRARTSDANGVVLANLWLVLVIAAPALLNVAATTLYPAPSRVELTTELREAATLAEQRAAEAREAYFFDHPDLAAGEQDPEVYFREVVASERDIESALAPLLEAFQRRRAERDRLIGTLQYLSPAVVTQRVLTRIAGTDDERYAEFRRQVIAFHQDYAGFFIDRLEAESIVRAADFEQIPRFQFQARDNLLGHIALPLTSMAALTLALIALALPQYRRYPVTQEATQP